MIRPHIIWPIAVTVLLTGIGYLGLSALAFVLLVVGMPDFVVTGKSSGPDTLGVPATAVVVGGIGAAITAVFSIATGTALRLRRRRGVEPPLTRRATFFCGSAAIVIVMGSTLIVASV